MKETLIERRIQELAFKSTFLTIREWIYSFESDSWLTTKPEVLSYFFDFDYYSIIEQDGIKYVSIKLEEAYSYEFYK